MRLLLLCHSLNLTLDLVTDPVIFLIFGQAAHHRRDKIFFIFVNRPRREQPPDMPQLFPMLLWLNEILGTQRLLPRFHVNFAILVHRWSFLLFRFCLGIVRSFWLGWQFFVPPTILIWLFFKAVYHTTNRLKIEGVGQATSQP